MFEGITKFFNKLRKKEETVASNSKEAAKERLHLVLMQDRANVSADFLELMKQEIIEVIKKYIDIDESAIDVRLTNKENEDGTNGAPALYANIPILNIKNDARKVTKQEKQEETTTIDVTKNKNEESSKEIQDDKNQKEETKNKQETNIQNNKYENSDKDTEYDKEKSIKNSETTKENSNQNDEGSKGNLSQNVENKKEDNTIKDQKENVNQKQENISNNNRNKKNRKKEK